MVIGLVIRLSGYYRYFFIHGLYIFKLYLSCEPKGNIINQAKFSIFGLMRKFKIQALISVQSVKTNNASVNRRMKSSRKHLFPCVRFSSMHRNLSLKCKCVISKLIAYASMFSFSREWEKLSCNKMDGSNNFACFARNDVCIIIPLLA